MKSRTWVVMLLALLPRSTDAGVFIRADLDTTDPFIIVHPTAYTGAGGSFELSICGTSRITLPAIRNAIAIWNARQATQGNCRNCVLWEDPVPTGELPPYEMTSVVLHELGHCGFGLGHTAWSGTSFTNSQEAIDFSVGEDLIRGSKDDTPEPLPGTRLIHWFRMMDNNPIVIDSTVIDGSTYSRRILDLPTGSSWPANANRCVSESLQVPFAALGDPCPVPPAETDTTQALMYPAMDPGMRISGLSADDVNTTAFAMTGLDLEAGTEDDYTVLLVYTEDCLAADIRVDFVPVDGPGETLGVCTSAIEPIGEALVQIHYRLVPETQEFDQLVIEVDVDETWDVLFVGDFESGDTSGWSESFAQNGNYPANQTNGEDG